MPLLSGGHQKSHLHWPVSQPERKMLLCQVIAELKDVSEKLQLPYHGLAQQKPQQQAAQQIVPRAMCLSISPTGKWAAVAVRNHVHVFDLEEHKHHGRLPALEVRVSPLVVLTCMPQHSLYWLAAACWPVVPRLHTVDLEKIRKHQEQQCCGQINIQ